MVVTILKHQVIWSNPNGRSNQGHLICPVNHKGCGSLRLTLTESHIAYQYGTASQVSSIVRKCFRLENNSPACELGYK